MRALQFLLVAVSMAGAQADYDCVCAYAVETMVYEKPDTSSNVIGYMYEFDCKPLYKTTDASPNYESVASEHQVGYIQNATTIQVQVCQGSIPPEDKVTTTLPPPTTSTLSTKTTTSLPTTSTKAPDTTSTTVTTTKRQVTTTLKTLLLTNMSSTTTTSLKPSPSSTKAVKTTHHSITPLVVSRLSSTTTTTMNVTTPSTKASTVSITPPSTTTPSTASSTTSSTTKSSTASSTTSSTTPSSTASSTTPPSTTSTSTQRKTTTTLPSTTKPTTTAGTSNRCPGNVLGRSSRAHIFTNQFYCYEFRNIRNDWDSARLDCVNHGGQLLSIGSQHEQDFIYHILQNQLRYNEPVWLGIFDLQHEGTWEWLSGAPVKYTNWMHGVPHDKYHSYENCGLFVTPRRGEWDDVHCRGVLLDTTANYPWICQYKLI